MQEGDACGSSAASVARRQQFSVPRLPANRLVATFRRLVVLNSVSRLISRILHLAALLLTQQRGILAILIRIAERRDLPQLSTKRVHSFCVSELVSRDLYLDVPKNTPDAYTGTPPAADWKRPQGRPRKTWLQ